MGRGGQIILNDAINYYSNIFSTKTHLNRGVRQFSSCIALNNGSSSSLSPSPLLLDSFFNANLNDNSIWRIKLPIGFTSNLMILRTNRPLTSETPNRNQRISDDDNEISSCIMKNPTAFSTVAANAISCRDPIDKSITAALNIPMNNNNQNVNCSHIPFAITPKDKSSEPSQLKASTSPKKKTLSQIASPYIVLMKPNLTTLVVLSAMSSYALSPNAATITQLISLTAGTALASGSANAINMGREPKFDAQMTRTKARPVVRGIVTPSNAYTFAAISGTLGISILYVGVNPTVAILGGLNIVLYSWIYTSLKRKSIINTWVGAIVGAIPPLMGWAASNSLLLPAAWMLPLLLYAWQFPHFNALSHNIRNEYNNAGYVMTAYTNPQLNARVALRYSLAMFPICFGLSYFGVTDWIFPFDSGLLNLWLSYWAYKFWKQQKINYKLGNNGGTSQGKQLANVYARKMFWGSIWHLPGVMVLAMLHKSGLWDRILGLNKEEEQF